MSSWPAFVRLDLYLYQRWTTFLLTFFAVTSWRQKWPSGHTLVYKISWLLTLHINWLLITSNCSVRFLFVGLAHWHWISWNIEIIFSIHVYIYLTKVKFKSFVHAIKACMGGRGRAPLILNLGTRWISVVSFMLQPLYHQRKSLVPTEVVPRVYLGG
jgi:L-lactate permease